MYRSRSTSSVYFDALHNSDGPSWTAYDPPEHRNRAPNGPSAGLSLTLPRSKEAPVTQNTLTSALTGSKMATNAGMPAGTSRRPLPKALLPKSARAPATPSAMYGSSLGLNSPGVVSRDIFSGSLTPTVAKSPAFTAELRFGVQRMESSPVGSALSSPDVQPNDHHVTESNRWNSLPRPQTAGVYHPGNSAQRPVDVGGRDSRTLGRSHPLASWTPVNATPVRRREPVVQDSIVPILKAALGKDNDPQDMRMQKEEESVNRQVFGRTARAAGSGTLRTVSMYGSTDDVFGKSNSYLQLSPYGDTKIDRVHLKSHSEVIPPRGFEDLQRKAVRNSMSSAVSTSDIYGTNPPGSPGVQEIAQKEFRSYGEARASDISQDLPSTSWEGTKTPGSPGVQEKEFRSPASTISQYLPSTSWGGPQHPRSSSRQVSSYGLRLAPAEASSSWNSPRSTSSFVHSNGTRPSPARTPSWEPIPPPPLSAPPIPSHPMNYPSTGRPSIDMDSHWYDPIPVQPRKVIMTPSVVLDSPRNLEDTKRSSRSLVFFGESFSSASYPLLAKVETDVANSGEADPIVTKRHSRNAGSKETVNLTVAFGWKDPASSEPSGKVNELGFHRDSPAKTVTPVQQRTFNVEHIAMPSPPIGFRDDASVLSLATTNAVPTTANMPPLPISHQATDSMNTEDSGLERWEKDGNDHSADEQDTSTAGHTTSAASSTGYRSSALKNRSGSWHEDTSEGRGSLSSSPRPNNSDEHGASPTDDPDLTIANSGSLVDDNMVPSNSILRQLLAENARQTTRNFDEATLGYGSDRESRSLGSHLDHSESMESSEPPPLPPSLPPPSDFDSDANGSAVHGIDSESCHSYSTAVQSTVTVCGSTADPGDRSRLTEDTQWGHGMDTLRISAVEDATKDEGALRERYTVVGDASLDLIKASIRLPGFRETQVSSQRITLEATRNGNERLNSETGRRGGAEEREEEGERMVFEIVKGPVGVGFCIEGGKGSLSGDRPVAVKRVFKGGSLDGSANLRPGDELLSIGAQSLVGLSHFEAWKSIKALPNGTFPLVIQRKRMMNQQPL